MGMVLGWQTRRRTFQGWRMCLERAIEFGWTPEGTVAATDFPGKLQGSPLAPSLHQGMEGPATW